MLTAIDTETLPTTELDIAPPLVCLSWASEDGKKGLLHHADAKQRFAEILSHDLTITCNGAFDMAVCLRQWPDLTPLVWQAYDENRVIDIQVAEKLDDIANIGDLYTRGTYSLADLSKQYLNRILDKETYRLNYGPLRDVALSLWPEGAKQYAIDDAVATLDIHLRQPKSPDLFRQTRHAWWIHLMAVWGIRTDLVRVARYNTRLLAEQDVAAKKLLERELIRWEKAKGWVRNEKNARAYIEKVFPNGPKTKPSKTFPKGQYCIDEIACLDSGDPYMEVYGDYASVKKQLSTDIPSLSKGELHSRFGSLIVSGRIECSGYNLTNLPREGEGRPCFIPRPGKVLIDCVAPLSQILLSDLTWAAAQDIKVGQELIGFDEIPAGRNMKFRRALVENVTESQHPCYKIVTDKGEIVCSFNHQWFAQTYPGQAKKWVKTEDLKIGHKIGFLAKPWKTDSSREAGYIAGFLDGEGYVGGGVGWGQNPGLVSDYIQELMSARGFKFVKMQGTYKCEQFGLLGGRSVGLRLLGEIRPRRLLAKSTGLWENQSLWGKRTETASVVSITFVGMQKTISIKTSTATFIAEGMLSHNCDYTGLEAYTGAQACITLIGDSDMADVLLAGEDVHIHMTAALMNTSYEEALAAYKAGDKNTIIQRQFSKIANYGLSGGMGDDTFFRHAQRELKKVRAFDLARGITFADTARIRRTWLERWREWPYYFERHGDLVSFGDYQVEQLVSGRKRLVTGKGRYAELNNTMFQGLGADAFKNAGWLLSRECYDPSRNSILFGSRPVNAPHDQFLVETDDDTGAHDRAYRVKALMEGVSETWCPDVPLKTDPCLTDRWYKGSKAIFDKQKRLMVYKEAA